MALISIWSISQLWFELIWQNPFEPVLLQPGAASVHLLVSQWRGGSPAVKMIFVRTETNLRFASTRLCRTSLHVVESLLSPRMDGRHRAILSSGENSKLKIQTFWPMWQLKGYLVSSIYWQNKGQQKYCSQFTSLLLSIVRNARPSDSGNYTCKPSIFKTAAVRLHVLTGWTKMSSYTYHICIR